MGIAMFNFFIGKGAEIASQFHCGDNVESYKYLGAHASFRNMRHGVVFRVYAPNAREVSVVGDFNNWTVGKDVMHRITGQGVFECFVPHVWQGVGYQYCIVTANGETIYRADPFAFHSRRRLEKTASVFINPFNYRWKDVFWQKEKQDISHSNFPINIYEIHLGSWRRDMDGGIYSYRSIADTLVAYVNEMGYTHVLFITIDRTSDEDEVVYTTRNYFSPDDRFGTPNDFMYLVDRLHCADIGVMIDLPLVSFPKEDECLYMFDGGRVFDEPDKLRRYDPSNGNVLFNYGKPEVQSFLLSAAIFWTTVYHIDAVKISDISPTLHLDHARKEGEFAHNNFGGVENLEGIAFLQRLNEELHNRSEPVLTIANDHSDWPNITHDSIRGGLGFDLCFGEYWTHELLDYMSNDPIFRKNHHYRLLNGAARVFDENYVLGFTHNNVMDGQCSMINKMPGDYDNKFSHLRVLYGYMMAHPGKKLLFMGCEIAQFSEWDANKSLNWMLLDFDSHIQLQRYIKALNNFYTSNATLFELDKKQDGFAWVVSDDSEQNVAVFSRYDEHNAQLICISNFAPVKREKYCIGVPTAGVYREVFNSDLELFGGTDTKNVGDIISDPGLTHGHNHYITITVPPLSTIYIRKENETIGV